MRTDSTPTYILDSVEDLGMELEELKQLICAIAAKAEELPAILLSVNEETAH